MVIDYHAEVAGQAPPAAVDPLDLIIYRRPSRYCESDRLHTFAVRHFGTLWQGHSRVMAIRDWVTRHVAFRSNTSNSIRPRRPQWRPCEISVRRCWRGYSARIEPMNHVRQV